jgi:Ca2+-binding RTX toxin-like protein
MRRLLWVALPAIVLASPAPAPADHVSISASVTARLLEERERSVTIRVSWSVTCNNATSPSYYGNLNLVDQATGQKIYMGGVSAGSGQADQIVDRLDRDRTMVAVLKISCASTPDNHGSETIEPGSNPVTVPQLGAKIGGGGGGGGSGGGGAGGDAGGLATGLPSGACATQRRGTAAGDRLVGTAGGDWLQGLGGDDRLRGRGGHDCLDGGPGRDRLEGEAGSDALRGGSGADTLIGGAGTNRYDAGPGNDVVHAANGRRETVRCGTGTDRVRADRADRLIGCERVSRR